MWFKNLSNLRGISSKFKTEEKLYKDVVSHILFYLWLKKY